jgi:hypothetical protein
MTPFSWFGTFGVLLSLYLLISRPAPVHAQDMVTPAEYTGVNIPVSDLAIFEAGMPRDDIHCKVEGIDPALGFDLNFHAGYQAEVPLAELAQGENVLNVLFRVYPVDNPREKRYFIQRFRAPDMEIGEDDSLPKGSTLLQGTIMAGPGKYQVDWRMRDRRERVCAGFWTFEVVGPPDAVSPVTLPPGEVRHAPAHPFKAAGELFVPKEPDAASLHIKVLVHVAPLNFRSAILQPLDMAALASILRAVSQNDRVGRVSVVVFNVREQRVLYRQDAVSQVDFPAIGEAIDTLNQGTIRYNLLADKNSDTRFLTNLITTEMAMDVSVDGMIFIGPKVVLEENPPKELLGEVGTVNFPLFYLNYNLHPKENPWRDAIGHAVRFFRGQEFTVYRPQDLFPAVRKMFAQIEDHKTRKSTASVGAQ